MNVTFINVATTLEVEDYKGLLSAWKRFGGRNAFPLCLVKRFYLVERPTDAQLRRLPNELKNRLSIGPMPSATAA
jgi:hypothetical protein